MPTLEDLARRARDEHPIDGPPASALERKHTRRVRHRASAFVAIVVITAVLASLTVLSTRDEETRSVVAQPRQTRWLHYVDPPAPTGTGVSARYPRGWADPVGLSNLSTPLSHDVLTLASYPIRPGGAICGSLPANALTDLPSDGALVTVIETRIQPEPRRPNHVSVFSQGQASSFPTPCPLDTVNGETWLTKFSDRGRNFSVFVAVGSGATATTRRQVGRVVNSLQFTPATVPVVRESFDGVLADGRPWTIRSETAGRGLCLVVDGVDRGCDENRLAADGTGPVVHVFTEANGGVFAYGVFAAGATEVVARYPDGAVSGEGVVAAPSGAFWALPLDPANNPTSYSLFGSGGLDTALTTTIVRFS